VFYCVKAELLALLVGMIGMAPLLRSILLSDCRVGPLLPAYLNDSALCFTSAYLVITALLGRVPCLPLESGF